MISPYRLTVEDLPDLDSKTRNALQPLLDALNTTLPQLVDAVSAQPPTKTVTSRFESTAAGSAYVDYVTAPVARATSVSVDHIQRVDGVDMAAPYSMTWQLTAAGVRLLFVDLDVSSQFELTVTIK